MSSTYMVDGVHVHCSRCRALVRTIRNQKIIVTDCPGCKREIVWSNTPPDSHSEFAARMRRRRGMRARRGVQ